jgi:hypothetical protein
MTEEKKTTLQGSGKKGGTIFPIISLADAVPLAKKLVSKTHVAPQPAEIILPGVFGSKGTNGEIRASALKQFALLEGKSTAYSATALAKKISSAPEEELSTLYAQACLSPKVFKLLYDTFHGDSVSLAKLRQQAATAGVHPDFQENCAELFVKSIEFSGLGTLQGDTVNLVPMGTSQATTEEVADGKSSEEAEVAEGAVETAETDVENGKQTDGKEPQGAKGTPMRAVINVSVTLDSSLDTEKLERQLALLRKYGAI